MAQQNKLRGIRIYLSRITIVIIMTDIPISTKDSEKEESNIRNRLMDELCKRQRDAERNGRPTEFRIHFYDVWESSFAAFQNREYIDVSLERFRAGSDYFEHLFRAGSDYFEHLPNDMVRLTEHGRRYCQSK
ncbi:hypothetical protein [Nitrososphaera sp. AFS]|uniref:hypothetical protein n=1 Tax=Nitrososphaera sp. AFS TaxID=2301191 RepID=UPI0013922819|nr:hypothetical protein [Nitrososphaera sp. AFS]NAL77888.1 hypothetical protein [Nitrososphaera sp. AFS]